MTGRRRGLLRVAVMAILGCGSLWILKKLGLLDIRPVLEAFREGWMWIGLAVLSLAGLLAVSAVRFFLLVRTFGIAARFRNVLAANLIGQAVGQWLPGSLAATEVLRFGVMSGFVGSKTEPESLRWGAGPKGRLGLAVFIDRLLGVGAMFAAGGLAGIILLAGHANRSRFSLLIVLSAVSLSAGYLALAAPFRRNRRLRRLAARAAGIKSSPADEASKTGPASRGIFRRTARKIFLLLETLEETRGRGRRPAAQIFLSLAATLFNALTLYFASLAAGRPLPFPVILAAVPFTIAAVFLPAGIAGFGGPQLLAAGVFSLFGADPKTVVAACLLQNTVVLAGQTIGGGLGGVVLAEHFASRPRRGKRASPDAGG